MNAQTKVLKNVYQRLNEARRRFHETELRKTGRNTFANYSYFELGDFLVPALAIFEEVGLCAIVTFTADTATMTITNVDNASETITFSSPMGSAQLKGCHEVQNIGAVETYQRRYLWVAALEIVEHDGLDATTGKTVANDKPEKPRSIVSDADLAKIIQLCEVVGGNQSGRICNAYKIEALPELSESQAKAVITNLERKLAEKAKAATNAEAEHV